MGILLVSFCLGCAGINQTIEDSQVTQKMKAWQAALKKKLSFDDDQSTAEDSAAVDKDAVASASKPSKLLVHTVRRRGETLPIIAQWYTDKSVNWKALSKANPRIDPQRIKIGSRVKIPGNLLVTREPMSPKFANKHLPTYYKHKICWSGETLSLISKWYTGNYTNWEKILNHNPEINPKRIKIGQTIYIPHKMLRTREALPQKFAAQGLPGYFAYTVLQPGENLAEISRRYTGDSNNWKAIAQANPDIDPKYLLVGNEIYIPSKLLKARAPIQNGADDISHQKPESQDPPAKPAASPKKKKDIQLFGPKQFPES
jgi:nucleoid-associated protein YgaU